MNKFILLLFCLAIIFFTSCSSRQVTVGQTPQAKIKGGDISNENIRSPIVKAEPLWIITEGLKGEAGFFASKETLPIASLKIEVSLIEFLASVNCAYFVFKGESRRRITFQIPCLSGNACQGLCRKNRAA